MEKGLLLMLSVALLYGILSKDVVAEREKIPTWKKYVFKIGNYLTKAKKKILNKVQVGLDIAGLAPGVGIAPDALNALIHAARGNKKGTLTSLAAMIPIAGHGATAGKYIVKYGKKYAKFNRWKKKVRTGSKRLKQYKKGREIRQEFNSTMTLKQAIAWFRNSVVKGSVKKPKKGVLVGKLPGGRTVTIYINSGHGPTLEIFDKRRSRVLKYRIRDN